MGVSHNMKLKHRNNEGKTHLKKGSGMADTLHAIKAKEIKKENYTYQKVVDLRCLF